MNSARLNDWMQVVGIFALVASLVFVGLQMRQTQEIASFEGLADGVDRILLFRELVSENAEAWSKGCLGEELTDKERIQFASVFEAYFGSTFVAWLRARQNDFGGLDPDVYVRRLAISLYRFPALSEYFSARQSWLGQEGLFQADSAAQYRDLVSREVARLAEGGGQLEADISMCGI